MDEPFKLKDVITCHDGRTAIVIDRQVHVPNYVTFTFLIGTHKLHINWSQRDGTLWRDTRMVTLNLELIDDPCDVIDWDPPDHTCHREHPIHWSIDYTNNCLGCLDVVRRGMPHNGWTEDKLKKYWKKDWFAKFQENWASGSQR